MGNVDQRAKIATILADLDTASPTGFAIALHIEFTTPKFLFQSYSTQWIDLYSKMGLVLKDPTVHWGFANTGSIRWNDLADNDPEGVLALAREHGLRYGVTVAILSGGKRSVASFSRDDREFLDVEVDALASNLKQLHEATSETDKLSTQIQDDLRKMSIRLTHA